MSNMTKCVLIIKKRNHKTHCLLCSFVLLRAFNSGAAAATSVLEHTKGTQGHKNTFLGQTRVRAEHCISDSGSKGLVRKTIPAVCIHHSSAAAAGIGLRMSKSLTQPLLFSHITISFSSLL